MLDTPATLDGSSGPPSNAFVAPSTPKKPWHAPLVIVASSPVDAAKVFFASETTPTNTAGPS